MARLQFPDGTKELIQSAPIEDMEQLYHDLKEWIQTRKDTPEVMDMLSINGNESPRCTKRPEYD